MSVCPSCRRPVAVARPTCLYCGAPLPPEAVAAAEEAAEEVRAELVLPGGARGPARGAASPERHLLIVEIGEQEPALLARLLDLSLYEAEMRLRLSGLQLHRVVQGNAEAGEREAARLRGALTVFLVPEGEARRAPVVARGGRLVAKQLELRTSEGTVSLSGSDLQLVVKGPIRREYQSREVERKKPTTARLEDGYRFHLHRHSDPRPVELDPLAFAFGEEKPLSGSSLLEITGWLGEIASGISTDDRFRRLPPALGAADEGPDALASVRGGRSASAFVRQKDAPAILDNVSQFRFYSGWRAAVERRRR